MRILFAILICTTYSYADVIDNVLRKAIQVENILNRSNNNSTNKKYSQNYPFQFYNNLNSKNISAKNIQQNNIPIIKRNNLLQNNIKKIVMSPNAKYVAYINTNDSKIIHIKSIFRTNVSDYLIQSEEPIKSIKFIGSNLLYTYYDESNFLQAKLVLASNNFIKQKRLQLMNEMKSIKILAKNNIAYLIECSDGNSYSLYKINNNNGNCNLMKEGQDHPTKALFNSKLNPVIIIKSTNSVENIYYNLDNSSKKKNNIEDIMEDNDEEEDNDSSLQLLEQIVINQNDTQYLSINNNLTCYKTNIKNDRLILSSLNVVTKETRIIYNLDKIPGKSQCKIYFNSYGNPVFITVNARRLLHIPLDNNTKLHINRLNSKFESWYRIDTSSDDKIWLICNTSDKFPNKFLLYDTRNGVIKQITQTTNIPQYTLSSTKYYTTPSRIQMFFNASTVRTNKPPLIMMFDLSNDFKWEYSPSVQLLANRGYNIMQVNCKNVDDNRFKRDVMEVVRYAINNKLCLPGNIILCAKKLAAIPIFELFNLNSKIFRGCILVNQNESSLSKLVNIEIKNLLNKSILILGTFPNSENGNTLRESLENTMSSILSKNTNMNDKLTIGLIDNYLSKITKNSRFEPLLKNEKNNIEIYVDNNEIISSPEQNESDEDDSEGEGVSSEGSVYDSL